MVLQIDPNSPAIVHVVAAAILYVHIGAGLLALVAGSASLIARKGSRVHRKAGTVFLVSMLIMATIGAAVSPFLEPSQWVNVVAGVFTLYLVTTGFLTVKRSNEVGTIEWCMFAVAVTIALAATWVASSPQTGSDATAAYVFAGVVTLAAIGDLRMILSRGLTSAQRLVRHLWRMCYGLLIATASLFLGQPQVFPEFVRGTGLLFVPVVAVLGAMIYWIIRVRLGKKRIAAAYGVV
jgi:uncharacterized membrane protein